MSRRVLISFPGSGRTWLRYLICKTLNLDLEAGYRGVFSISHSYYKNQVDRRVLHLVRDPIATITSCYFKEINGLKVAQTQFNPVLFEYLKLNLPKALRHIRGWESCQSKYYQIQYEDLHGNTEDTLRSVLDFWDMDFLDENIKEAVEFCNFSNLKNLSKELGDTPLKYREGKVNGYSDLLSQQELEDVESLIREWYNTRNSSGS